jgi:hypothetical protein
MTRRNAHQRLTYRIDQYVHELVDEAEMNRGTLTIEQKTALLNAFGKWIAIKNKLIDGLEGEKFADFRARLKQGAAPGPETGPPYVQRVNREQKQAAGRKSAAARWGIVDPATEPGGPSGLAAFKARIPRADDRGDGGEVSAAGADGSVNAPLLGDC